MKILYCEVCGSPGASKWEECIGSIEGEFDMCTYCHNRYEEYNIEGATREEILAALHDTALTCHGPQSCTTCRSNDIDKTCAICHKNHCLDCLIIFGGKNWGKLEDLPKELIPMLPKEHRKDRSLPVCYKCIYALIKKYAFSIKEKDLPLYLEKKVFDPALQGYDYNDLFKASVIDRLHGKSFPTFSKTLGDPSVIKCLEVSLSQITDRDFHNLSESCKASREEKHGDIKVNALAHEHGFFIILKSTMYTKGEYSMNFMGILRRARELGYGMVSFDSNAPEYSDLMFEHIDTKQKTSYNRKAIK